MAPVKKWSGRKPLVNHLRTFGCITWVNISNYCRKKLDVKIHACSMMGHLEELKSYRLFDPVKWKIFIRRNVIFDEKTLSIKMLNSSSSLLYSDHFDIFEEFGSTRLFSSTTTRQLTYVLESTISRST